MDLNKCVSSNHFLIKVFEKSQPPIMCLGPFNPTPCFTALVL